MRELREHHRSIPHTDWACEIHGQACIVVEIPLSVNESALIRPEMETGNVRRPNRRANLQPACVAPTLGGAFLTVPHLHAFICQCVHWHDHSTGVVSGVSREGLERGVSGGRTVIIAFKASLRMDGPVVVRRSEKGEL